MVGVFDFPLMNVTRHRECSFVTTPNVAPKVSIVDQLAKANIKPEQIKYVGISHYHGDHTGQVASFPKATLLIGKGDWDILSNPKPAEGVPTAPFASWIKGDSKVGPVPTDKDVFGDGSVIMLYTPGHTPGHHSLLVKLPTMGTVFISGDLAHFHENYDTNDVPWFNFDRAQTLASLDRAKKVVANTKATVILQHDARDVDKLPAFPNGLGMPMTPQPVQKPNSQAGEKPTAQAVEKPKLPPAWTTDAKTGCRVWDESPKPNETISWSGGCFDRSEHGFV
jgi:glyoxylase-like metal-dependent hydrolase (beta-lactamase superfamily II)